MEQQSYRVCIGQQLEELDLLNSIYCGAGELQLLDASVVADFNEFLLQSATPTPPTAHLEYIIALMLPTNEKLDVRIELPHLYPLLERAIVSVHTPLLSKAKQLHLKAQLELYLDEQQQEEPYIYQLLSWLQEQIELLIQRPASEFEALPELPESFDFERLWIYSHHIKSSAKRQELIRQARQLELSGFSRPGKPGIICVEGVKEQVQEFWRSIKALRWQKISVVKSEQRLRVSGEQLQRQRRFEDFSEQLFNVEAGEEGVMNMGHFIKFLETHNSGYMKAELFGLA